MIRLNELDHWAPIPTRYNAFRVSLAGTLKGLEGIHQGRNLKVKPFVTGGFTQVRGVKTSKDHDGGVDLKYSLTASGSVPREHRFRSLAALASAERSAGTTSVLLQ